MSQYQFSLDVLLSRDVAIQWFEAVALVQSVCRQILAGPAASAGFPAASQILLRSDGSVSIVGSSNAGNAVENAGRLLADLRCTDAPVQLRLLLTQAAGGDAAYPTLSEFSAALAYFERSSPHLLLQQLFERAAGAGTRKDVPAQRAPESASVQSSPLERDRAHENTPQQPAPPRKRGNTSQVLAAAAVVVALAGGGTWFFVFGPGRTRVTAAGTTMMKQLGLGTPVLSAEPGTPSAEPLERDTTVAPGANTASPAAGDGRLNGSEPPIKKGDRLLPVPVRRTASTRPAMLPLTVRAAAQDLLPALFSQTVRYEIPASPASALESSMLLGEPRSPDPRVYSLTDAEVVPPRAIYPTFPEPPRDLPAERRTVVEVVIDNDGSVERVRLRSRPRNIHEFMLLSAAKAWRFEPATIDGRPVRFLHSLTLIMQ